MQVLIAWLSISSTIYYLESFISGMKKSYEITVGFYLFIRLEVASKRDWFIYKNANLKSLLEFRKGLSFKTSIN